MLAVIAASAAWFTLQQPLAGSTGDSSSGSNQSQQRIFPAAELSVEDVDGVRIERRGLEPLTFKRDANGNWSQLDPFPFPMDAFSLRQLPRLSSELLSSGTIERTGESTLASLGLDPPAATLTLTNSKAGREVTVRLGRRTVGGRAYMQKERDGPVFIVTDELARRVLEESPASWRDARFFQYAGVESTRVEVLERQQSGEYAPGYTMERERRRWVLAAPLRTRLNQQMSEERMGRLADLNSRDFIVDQPDDLGAYGLKEPLMKLSVTSPMRQMQDGRAVTTEVTETLLLGGPRSMEGSEFYFMIEGVPVVRAMPRRVVDELRAIGQLIELLATGIDSADVKSFRVSGETEFTIARDDEDPSRWVAVDFSNAQVPSRAVQQLLDNLTSVAAIDAVVAEYPYDQEIAYITFNSFAGLPLDAVRIAKHTDGTWIISNGDGILRLFQPSMSLPLTPADFGL